MKQIVTKNLVLWQGHKLCNIVKIVQQELRQYFFAMINQHVYNIILKDLYPELLHRTQNYSLNYKQCDRCKQLISNLSVTSNLGQRPLVHNNSLI